MKKLKFIGELLLPLVLSFIPFGISLEIYNQVEEPTEIIVGLLTPSILASLIFIRQRKNDYDRKEAIQRRRVKNYRRKKK
jgi:hypothetical protein